MFMNLDLRNVYYLFRLHEGDEWNPKFPRQFHETCCEMCPVAVRWVIVGGVLPDISEELGE